MKKLIFGLFIFILFSCYQDPLFEIRRLARSSEIENKQKAGRDYQLAITTLFDAYTSYAGLNRDLGYKLMINQNYKVAIKHLEISKDVKNNDSTVYFWIATCYANLYKIEKKIDYLDQAEKNYKISLNIIPNNKEVNYSYAQFLIYLKEEYNKAVEVLNKCIFELNADEPNGYFLLGRAYYMLGEYAKAYETYNTIYKFKKILTKEQSSKLDEFIQITRSKMQNE
ncbi:MAG: hypothetical protein A2086_10700 [Spirochaetes bacterium GWD1_27_9]|nr:MAG: hypothetical protein A2Z98_03290 [Spirochaetes bacterium GWB1_27_13]OHD21459.1 MAG: hypothetical protein A2Y34_01235 [Spirochaetes bacterium GWC1_27_15]OHD35173.1 MAG: hypothetical protein A2086_10700 [Spirochaetes bacterium GWD1_27_9]